MRLTDPSLSVSYHQEPVLKFGCGRLSVSPKHGLTAFGPRTLDDDDRHPERLRLGFIGSGKSIGSAKAWIESCQAGVQGDDDNETFPGFSAEHGFYSQLVLAERLSETITTREIREVAEPRLRRDRFERAVDLLDDKLRLISERDQPPDCVVLALPDTLLEHCRVVDFRDSELGQVHRDFRRVLKSIAMKYRLPTQILLQKTSEATPESRNVDHKSRCAWNFFTSLYFKCGSVPWSPHGLSPGTCHIGVSFHRRSQQDNHKFFTSTAQAFDEHGEGLVLRGQDFNWDSNKLGPSPHLSADMAAGLVRNTLARYQSEMQQVPSRVVLHKSSVFWPEEREGFADALRGVHSYDLLSCNPVSDMRLLRDGQYPVLRGTQVQLGNQHLLYTTGFIPSLNAYPHGHVPSPLKVFDHVGDSPMDLLLPEILTLTKINWNTAAFSGLLPITLRSSRVVGEIMTEIPNERAPLPQFKYYV